MVSEGIAIENACISETIPWIVEWLSIESRLDWIISSLLDVHSCFDSRGSFYETLIANPSGCKPCLTVVKKNSWFTWFWSGFHNIVISQRVEMSLEWR